MNVMAMETVLPFRESKPMVCPYTDAVPIERASVLDSLFYILFRLLELTGVSLVVG
jgi:hypothetical protein